MHKTKAVLKVTGWTRSHYDNVMSMRLVTPAKPARKRGSAAYFNLANLMQFMIIDRLGDVGLTLTAAAEIANELVETYDTKYLSQPDDSFIGMRYRYGVINLEDPSERNQHQHLPEKLTWTMTLVLDLTAIQKEIEDILVAN